MAKKKATKKKAPRKKKEDDVEVWNPPADATLEAPGTMAEQVTEAGLILDACGQNEEVAQFFLLWLKNGRIASKAYKMLHPHVTDQSAKTLGARLLTKVDRTALAAAWDVGIEEYMQQLKDGLNASKKVYKNNNESGEIELVGEEPDHKTRRDYHKALGEIIGIEQKVVPNTQTAIQVNLGKAMQDWIVTE